MSFVALLLDPVKAADGHVYSRHALAQWFAIRCSSPLHGTELENDTMVNQDDIAEASQDWVDGVGLIGEQEDRPSKRRRPSVRGYQTVEFQSSLGTFKRLIPGTLSINDL